MRENPYPIAPEGVPFIGIALALTAGAFWIWNIWVACVPFVFLLFCIWFFRDPHRVPSDKVKENSILCPADGVIVDICEVEEGRILKRPMKKISIFMSPLNVHVNGRRGHSNALQSGQIL